MSAQEWAPVPARSKRGWATNGGSACTERNLLSDRLALSLRPFPALQTSTTHSVASLLPPMVPAGVLASWTSHVYHGTYTCTMHGTRVRTIVVLEYPIWSSSNGRLLLASYLPYIGTVGTSTMVPWYHGTVVYVHYTCTSCDITL